WDNDVYSVGLVPEVAEETRAKVLDRFLLGYPGCVEKVLLVRVGARCGPFQEQCTVFALRVRSAEV
ncbi:hypothetical protein NGM37_57385, partial [Streptomyces sp. TRM76130]|nr:hypothetical protein [Streptomyces sp. TRM76130]